MMRKTSIGAVVLAVAGGTLVAAPAVADDTPHAVTVTVTTDDGAGVPSAFVEILDATSVIVALGYTDTTGVATLPSVPAGTYSLYADASLASTTTPLVVADADATARVQIDGISLLSGHVRDAVSGSPISGDVDGTPAVQGEGSDFWFRDSGEGFTRVVLSGRYRLRYSTYLDGYLGGAYPDVVGDGAGYVLDLRHDVPDLEVKLHRLPTIGGRVSLVGKGLTNTYVTVSQGSPAPVTSWGYAPTGSNGRYSVVTRPGTYYPSVGVPDGTVAGYFPTYYGNTVRRPDARPVTVGPDMAPANVDIALVAKATLKGTVLTAKGKPAKYVDVEAYSTTRAGSATARTDSHGRYTLTGLAGGPVAIAAYGTGFSSPVRIVTAVQGTTVTATTLKTTSDAEVDATIRTTGSKPSSQDVSLFDAHHDYLGTVRPDSSGRVGLWSLAAGTYYLTIDGSNVQRKFTLKAHKKLNLGTITRGRLVTVSGTVRTAAGKPAVGALVSVTDAHDVVYKKVRTDSHGHYSVKGAVAGTYHVNVRPKKVGADAWGTTKITVKAGHSAKANVRLTASGNVTGRVLNAQGKPAIGVHVVTIDGRDVRTNATGTYTITGLHAGANQVFATDTDYVGGYRDGATTVKVRSGKTVTAPTIRVS